MSADPRNELAAMKMRLAESFIRALEAGVPLDECLEILGVSGTPRMMIRAYLSRVNEAEIPGMLRNALGLNESLERAITDEERQPDYTS